MKKIILAFIAVIFLSGFRQYGALDQTPITSDTRTSVKIEMRTEEKNKPIPKARLDKIQPKEQENGIRELRGKK